MRIGNLARYKDTKEITTIYALQHRYKRAYWINSSLDNNDLLEPIPIADAEEWLLSVGFMEHKLLNRKRFWIVNWNINIFKGGKVKVSFNGLLYEHIKYVHQLQNLFYYSTDQELITKLNKYVQY